MEKHIFIDISSLDIAQTNWGYKKKNYIFLFNKFKNTRFNVM